MGPVLRTEIRQKSPNLPASTPKCDPATAARRVIKKSNKAIANKKNKSPTDAELFEMALSGTLQHRLLETALYPDTMRAVKIRRVVMLHKLSSATRLTAFQDDKGEKGLPFQGYDWSRVYGKCCENVVGYVPLPVGPAGPLLVDGQEYYLPMATTEGTLVASTSRECKAIDLGGGATTAVHDNGASCPESPLLLTCNYIG